MTMQERQPDAPEPRGDGQPNAPGDAQGTHEARQPTAEDTTAFRVQEPAGPPPPAPDWARVDALRAARPHQSSAAPDRPSSVARGMRLTAAGLLLLGSVGGGLVGSAATLAVTGRFGPAAQVAAQNGIPPTSTLQRTSAEVPSPPKTDIAAVARQVSPAVVMVLTRENTPGGLRPRTEGEGTGFIVDASGLILTNNHVVEGASRITVVFADGTRDPNATVVGRDPQSDLALLKAKLPASNVAVAVLGDSDLVEPGETAIAIGAPFGLSQSVTAGIVSAVKRDWGSAGGRPMRGLIQTDAPVNPGNSGGPLLNANGEVIGITTAIESPVRGSVGIGFAIPINQAKKLLPQLSTGATVEHPWLGISGIAITPDVAEEQRLPVKEGVLVAEVISDGPAQKAGVRGGRAAAEGEIPVGGDIITAVDGRKVVTVQEISRYLDTLKVGDKVRLTVLRDGKTQEITVTLGAWQRPPQQQ